MAFQILLMILCSTFITASNEVFKIPLRRGVGIGSAQHPHPLHERARRSSPHGNLGGTPGQGYYIEMGIGTPAQMLNVLVDTGSSNFAIAAAPHNDVHVFYNSSRSSTYVNLGTEIYVPYTKGDWHGVLARDSVTAPALGNLSVSAEFACIDSATEFYINGSDWQGILGMAYAEIARPDASVEPFFDSVIKQTNLASVFSMQLCGEVDSTNISVDRGMGGSMVLGGLDTSLYRGDIMYTPIHKQWYYEVVITEMKVADSKVDLPCKEFNFDKTIVDSGTTNFRLPTTVFKAVTDLIAKNTHLAGEEIPASFWIGDQILCWTAGSTPWSAFPSLTVTLPVAGEGNTTFDLVVSPQQYLRPVEDEFVLSVKECYKYAIVPSDTGAVIGAVIMEGFYVVFDRERQRVGFAETTCPRRRGAGSLVSHVTTPRAVQYAVSACAYVKLSSDRSAMLIVAYVLAALCALCLLLLVAMVMHWQVKKCRRSFSRTDSDTRDLIDAEEEEPR